METATPAIRVSTTPTYQSYRRLMLWTAMRSQRRLMPWAILAIFCFLVAPTIHLGDPPQPMASYGSAWAVLILPGIVFVMVPVSIILVARKRWRTVPELRAPRAYVFSDAGIEIVADSFHSTFGWDLLVTALRSGDQVLLGTGQNLFYFFRVTDFSSPEDYERLRSLVSSKVADCRL